MIPSNQISTNIKSSLEQNEFFACQLGLFEDERIKGKKDWQTGSLVFLSQQKKAKKCVNFKTLNMVCDMLKMFAKL